MRTMLQPHQDWLTVVQMPSYAPDLNPVEGAWSTMKNSLGNLGSCSTPHRLAAIMKNRLKRIQYRPALINGFLARPASASNPNRHRTRPRPFNLCKQVRDRDRFHGRPGIPWRDMCWLPGRRVWA